MSLSKAMIILCLLPLLAVAVPVPTRLTSYGDFKYSEPVTVRHKQEARFTCSGTFSEDSRLRWYREKGDESGVLLEVTDRYWKTEFDAEYQISASHDSMTHYYMSQLTIRSAKQTYAGRYYCKAVNGSGDILVKSEPILLEVIGGKGNCQDPAVTGMSAQWDNSTKFTTVDWTIDPPLKSSWCRGNKLVWFFRSCSWDNVDQIPDNLTSVDPTWCEWISLNKRQTLINLANTSNEEYFMFEIGWRSKHKDVMDYTFTSKVFYFGEQVGARITKAEDVAVKSGDKATLSCAAVGLPQPKVIWTVALSGSNPSSGSRHYSGPTYNIKPTVSTAVIENANHSHSRRYTCLAKNTIIRNGVKTTVIDTATMTLTVD